MGAIGGAGVFGAIGGAGVFGAIGGAGAIGWIIVGGSCGCNGKPVIGSNFGTFFIFQPFNKIRFLKEENFNTNSRKKTKCAIFTIQPNKSHKKKRNFGGFC